MISFENVRKEYPGGTVAVRNLTMVAPTGKLTVLVGPSGCGKTTSLRMVNRLDTPTSGTIRLEGEATDKMDVALLRRRIGYVRGQEDQIMRDLRKTFARDTDWRSQKACQSSRSGRTQ